MAAADGGGRRGAAAFKGEVPRIAGVVGEGKPRRDCSWRSRPCWRVCCAAEGKELPYGAHRSAGGARAVRAESLQCGAGPSGEHGRRGASGCSGPSAWERVGRSARSAGEENGSASVGRAGERKRGNGPAGFGLFCWVGLVSGFLFSGFLSPFLFLFLNNSNLFEFKFKFEFNSNTQTKKRIMHQHECNNKC